MAKYKFALLDPRKGDEAARHNESVFEMGPVLGIEVTVPALAARCSLGNIDPQHSGGQADQAAIEAALTCELPPDGAVLVTIRPDLDSIGAMAVLSIRASGELERRLADHDAWHEMARIVKVAEADKFARGGWPGPRPLPTKENPWPEGTASAESSRPLAAIAAAVSDFKLPIEDRVHLMVRWLLWGEEPKEYRERVEKERMEIIQALESGAITVRTVADGRIAVVESTHRAATMVGYMLAPIVIALNPKFRFQGGPEHAKYTIAQFTQGYVDLAKVRDDLNGREPGWGGSPTIIGSPQGVSSQLTLDEVIEVVKRLLK